MNNIHKGHEWHNHDIHTVMTPTHEAFNDLIKENVKSKFLKDAKVMSEVEKLGDIWYNLVLSHLDEMMNEITNSYNEMKKSH